MKYFNHILTGLLIASASLFSFNDALGQAVGIDDLGLPPYEDAILDMKHSTNPELGVLFPRAAADWAPAAGNRNGLIYYNTTDNEYRYWDNAGAGSWRSLLSGGATLPYVENRTTSTQTANFNISGSGNIGGGIVIGSTTLTPAANNILMSVDDSWIGTGITAADTRMEFDKTSGSQGVRVLINRASTGASTPTVLTLENEGTASGVGLVLSGTRNTDAGPTGFIDFNNDDSGVETLGRIGVINADDDNSDGSLHISLRENGSFPLPAVAQLRLASDGDLVIEGKFTSNGIKETSDGRFKKNIKSISLALSTVMNLEGVTYNWRTDEFPNKSFTDRMEYGVIAQQIEKIVPELVDTDEDGYKSVQYSHMVPLLIEAIKEQQLIINSQSQEIGVLKASVEAISEHIKTAQK